MAGGQSSSGPDEARGARDASRDELVLQVRDALAHLHDPAYLETHPLTRYLLRDQSARKPLLGRALRQALLDALESLHPGRDAGPLSRHSQLLQLRYVEGLDVREVYDRLAISRTEFYREHQKAVEAVASILRSLWRIAETPDEAEEGKQVALAVEQLERAAPGAVVAARPPNNLPVQLTTFVGREREMAEIRRLLDTTRLLTLTGTGGCGKTRLAYQVAADLLTSSPEEYPDGIWTVELASLGDPSLVAETATSALGLREEAGHPILDTLVDHLRPKRLLLVLDNCEHLLDASARLVDTLLRACPELRVLATSREALGIAGETSYRVPSLALPDLQALPPFGELAACESVRLFVERAMAVQPSFDLTEQDAQSVARICWRLDGMPLAIELAAARVRGLTVEGIARRLDDRFRLLTGGSRTALRRQQTLRATIDWSYALLSPPERCLFRRLAVFSGGWSLGAAESVCTGASDEVTIGREDVLDLLLRLVDRSLVVAGAAIGEERYHFVETIRQYALEKLVDSGEVARMRDRHRDWCARLLETCRAMRSVDEMKRGLAWIDLEYDNLRSALAWCVETEPPLGLRLVATDELGVSLGWFWISRGHPSEGRHLLRELLARAPDRTAARALALLTLCVMASDQGDLEEADLLVGESLRIASGVGDAFCALFALVWEGNVAQLRGETQGAIACLEEALGISRGIGDPYAVAYTLHWLGRARSSSGDTQGARACWEEALDLIGSSGFETQWAYASVASWASACLGALEQGEGNYSRARGFLESAVATIQELGDVAALGWSLSLLGYAVGKDGERERGTVLLRESVTVLQRQGHRIRLGWALVGLGILEGDRGAHARASRLIGAGLRLIGKVEDRDVDACLTAARSAFGEEAFARAWAEGQAMTLDQAVEYALRDEGLSAKGLSTNSATD